MGKFVSVKLVMSLLVFILSTILLVCRIIGEDTWTLVGLSVFGGYTTANLVTKVVTRGNTPEDQ